MSTASRRARRSVVGSDPRPVVRASLEWRLILKLLRVVARSFDLRLRVEGLEHVPAGPFLIAAAPHRSWIDPFVLLFALPPEPRVHFLGDAEAIQRDAFRRFWIRRLGGAVPIRKGERGIEGLVDAVRAIVASGARVAVFPERGPAVPPERARPFSAGIGYLALRTGAPIVPAVIGGNHELYLRRRVALRFLPRLVVPPTPPSAGSREERAAAHVLMLHLERTMAEHVAELFRATEPLPGSRKRWRWLTTAFR